jgi:branched-chain amino acid transport system permease protein
MMSELLQGVVSGLLVGLTYAILGVGFSLTWGANGVINISHSAFAVLAAYLGYYSVTLYNVNPILSLVLIIPLFFIIGVLINKTLIITLEKKTRHIGFASMVLTFGIAIVLENLMQEIFSADPRLLKAPYLLVSYKIGQVYISGGQIIASLLSLGTLVLVYLFLYVTFYGKAVRAFEQEPQGAALTGINTGQVGSLAVGIAIASAGVAGVAMSLIYPFEPAVHLHWLIVIFLVVILGGVGSVPGTLVAGLIVGLIVTVSGVWIPYSLVNLVMFVILILILAVRPKGLFSQ